MDVNTYLARRYGPQPCWELVADVYASELQALAVDYQTINRSVRQMAGAFRLAIHKSAHGFKQVATPVDLCIVLLGKSDAIGIHHCGIFYQGKVLHAQPNLTLFEDLIGMQDTWPICEFWAKDVAA